MCHRCRCCQCAVHVCMLTLNTLEIPLSCLLVLVCLWWLNRFQALFTFIAFCLTIVHWVTITTKTAALRHFFSRYHTRIAMHMPVSVTVQIFIYFGRVKKYMQSDHLKFTYSKTIETEREAFFVWIKQCAKSVDFVLRLKFYAHILYSNNVFSFSLRMKREFNEFIYRYHNKYCNMFDSVFILFLLLLFF